MDTTTALDLVNSKALSKDTTCLWLAEVGSCAWGYNSPTSDHDLKALTMLKDTLEYSTLFEQPRPVTTELSDTTTVTTWDLHKTLNLAFKGNASVYELFNSPLVHHTTTAGKEIADFCSSYTVTYRLLEVAYQYGGIVHEELKKFKAPLEPTLKDALYVGKQLLHYLYLLKTKQMPALDYQTLLDQCTDAFVMNSTMKEVFTSAIAERRYGDPSDPSNKNYLTSFVLHNSVDLFARLDSQDQASWSRFTQKPELGKSDFNDFFKYCVKTFTSTEL